MVMTDPIADMLTRVRNANSVKHESVDIPPRSTMKEELSRILKDEGGFIRDYKVIEDGKQGIIRVYLKYDAVQGHVIQGIKRISKPGLRVYANKEEVPRVLGGPWSGYSFHFPGHHYGPDRPAKRHRRRGNLLCVVRGGNRCPE